MIGSYDQPLHASINWVMVIVTVVVSVLVLGVWYAVRRSRDTRGHR